MWTSLPATPAGRALALAFAPYRAGDYAAAATAFDGVRLDHPEDPTAALYLGISRLFIDEPQNALEILRTLPPDTDPAIAGQFGRESVQAVLNADGTLADSQIDGAQVGDQIARSGRLSGSDWIGFRPSDSAVVRGVSVYPLGLGLAALAAIAAAVLAMWLVEGRRGRA